MERQEILQQIRAFADRAHGDQMRKYTPERYIVHPVQVMEICAAYTDDITVLGAALLHDVLEDTPVKEQELMDFLSGVLPPEQARHTLQLTIELTDQYTKAAYPHLNRRARKEKEHERSARTSADAQTIKYADIISNSIDIARHDKDFGPKFLREVKSLLKKMVKGNKELHQRAVETVEECLRQVKA